MTDLAWTVVAARGALVHGYATREPVGYVFMPNGHPAGAPGWRFYDADHGNWWVSGHVDEDSEDGAYLLAQHRLRAAGMQ